MTTFHFQFYFNLLSREFDHFTFIDILFYRKPSLLLHFLKMNYSTLTVPSEKFKMVSSTSSRRKNIVVSCMI